MMVLFPSKRKKSLEIGKVALAIKAIEILEERLL
jgi:hypothetical protein